MCVCSKVEVGEVALVYGAGGQHWVSLPLPSLPLYVYVCACVGMMHHGWDNLV